MLSAKRQLSREETICLRQRHIGSSCKLFFREDPLHIVGGRGSKLYDEQGQEYLDCINNVAHVGHCNQRVVEAEIRQAQQLNTNSRFLHENLVLYAEKLSSLFPEPLSVVFMVNSGSEANDLALRLAKSYTGASDVITLDHAYHGHVTSAISISPYKFRQLGPAAQSDHVHVVPCPDSYRGQFTDRSHPGQPLGQLYADTVRDVIERLQERGRRPAAFIAESLQSCGGQVLPPEGYLRQVYKYVREAGGVCIADEVQVGFGRVGSHWWAFQTQGDDVIPDIVSLGKPMGNGYPVAAVVTTQEVADSFASSGVEYFNTYGGNPVACAVAMAVLQTIEDDDLRENCLKIENLLKEGLGRLMEKHEIIGDIRIRGMFAGVELVKDRASRQPATAEAQDVIKRMIKERVLLSTDGPDRNVLKFKPPLVFSEADCDHLLRTLDGVLTALQEDQEALAAEDGELSEPGPFSSAEQNGAPSGKQQTIPAGNGRLPAAAAVGSDINSR